MIVVVIIGMLAAIAIPAFSRIRDSSRVNKTLNDIRIIEYGFQTYSLEAGAWPEDTDPGVFPPEMTGIIQPMVFENPTPLGGLWDWDNHLDDHGIAGITLAGGNGAPAIRENLVIQTEEKIEGRGLDEGIFRRIPAFGWGYVTYIFEDLNP